MSLIAAGFPVPDLTASCIIERRAYAVSGLIAWDSAVCRFSNTLPSRSLISRIIRGTILFPPLLKQLNATAISSGVRLAEPSATDKSLGRYFVSIPILRAIFTIASVPIYAATLTATVLYEPTNARCNVTSPEYPPPELCGDHPLPFPPFCLNVIGASRK